MGRPLKIAKAQAVLTITDTATTGSIVTVSGGNLTTSPTVGITAGMPFVVASNISGLVAGVIYYVDTILSNTTLSVSETDLSVQPRVMATLTNSSGGTVKASFAVVDGYFNNPTGGTGYPATNANTYSVVGGNTAIFGKQVLANVALGVNGTGTLYAYDDSNVVGGLGTDLGNIANTSVIQYASTGGLITLGYVSNAAISANIEISNATATGNFLTTVGNAQLLTANLPVTLTANIGGLTTGTTYFVKTIANAAAFSVSLAAGGANVGLTNEDAESYALQNKTLLAANATANISGAAYIYATPEAGYIVRQKGKQKYLVQGTSSGLIGQCFTANVANTAMLPNTMTITATYANSSTVKVQSLSDHTAELFSSTSGPVATGNIVLANADPAFGTFNNAAAANATDGQPYPIVTIGNA